MTRPFGPKSSHTKSSAAMCDETVVVEKVQSVIGFERFISSAAFDY